MAKAAAAPKDDKKAEKDAGPKIDKKAGRWLVMAGRTTDRKGVFVGFDGERRRFAGEKFWVYQLPLPSWCRIQDKDGNWVNAPDRVAKLNQLKASPAPKRRAHPKTLPGQAPTRRIHELEEDEAELNGAPPRGGDQLADGSNVVTLDDDEDDEGAGEGGGTKRAADAGFDGDDSE
jgi:hypothetical protein